MGESEANEHERGRAVLREEEEDTTCGRGSAAVTRGVLLLRAVLQDFESWQRDAESFFKD